MRILYNQRGFLRTIVNHQGALHDFLTCFGHLPFNVNQSDKSAKSTAPLLFATNFLRITLRILREEADCLDNLQSLIFRRLQYARAHLRAFINSVRSSGTATLTSRLCCLIALRNNVLRCPYLKNNKKTMNILAYLQAFSTVSFSKLKRSFIYSYLYNLYKKLGTPIALVGAATGFSTFQLNSIRLPTSALPSLQLQNAAYICIMCLLSLPSRQLPEIGFSIRIRVASAKQYAVLLKT